MKILNYIYDIIAKRGAGYFILIDPDKIPFEEAGRFVKICEESDVDAFLIGNSLTMNGGFDKYIIEIKKNTSKPVIVFPGAVTQVSASADALFFLSVVSGRNPEHLIGKHVLAAPMIKNVGLEPIPVAYMLIESGSVTTALYMSGSQPVPRNKPEIAAATALAAEYLGMKLIYLEAGSGADNTTPNEMVKVVSNYCSIPVIVGGGIKTPECAKEKVDNGAKIIVTGNFFEDKKNWSLIKDFAAAIHKN